MPRQRISLPGKTVGSIEISARSTAPDGYLTCDGSAISRTLYSKLFDIIGTTHGVGDGVDTFNIPDYRYLVPRGRGGVADQVVLPAAVNITTEEITVTGHQYKRNGFRVRVSSTGTIIGGLAINTDYYVIIVDANTIKLATTRANAIIGTAINLTSQGTGVHTISQSEGPDFSSRTAVNGGNAGDNVGSLEEDAFRSHTHTYASDSSSNWAGGGNVANFVQSPTSNTGATGGNETRSSNILCNYIIKVI